jgi:hypothetical protein
VGSAKLNVTHFVVVYVDNVNKLGGSVRTVQKQMESFVR